MDARLQTQAGFTRGADASRTQTTATNVLEAIVFREILKPLAAGLGPVGDVAIGSVADAMFARPKT